MSARLTPIGTVPSPPTPFVGRSQELSDIAAQLMTPTCRLVTVTGPGGIGKTRLALQVVQRLIDTPAEPHAFAHGIIFVPLAPITSPSGIVAAIAAAAGLQFYSDVPPQQQLLDYLREKALLLVLDNVEHLLDGVDLVIDILTTAPAVKLLCTSREPLRLQEEWLRPLGGLPFPSADVVDDRQADGYAAVQLFVQRARRVNPSFTLAAELPGVVRISRLLEGMPLALELAASWLNVLPCATLVQELERNLDLLATRLRNVPERHQSMRAVFEHSWHLLNDADRVVLKRLAVFHGSFTSAAAAQVAGASLLNLVTLVDTSLLQTDASGRYQLHALLRQFAAEQLMRDPAEDLATRQRHGAYYRGLLHAGGHVLRGPRQQQALAEIAAEIENVRAGWSLAIVQGDVGAVDGTLDALYDFFRIGSRYQEGEEVLGYAAAQLGGTASAAMQPQRDLTLQRIRTRQGAFHAALGQTAPARRLLQESLAAARARDDRAEIAFVLTMLGEAATWQGRFDEAEQLLHEGLAVSRGIADAHKVAHALYKLAELGQYLGKPVEAKRRAEESLALSRRLGRQDRIAYALDKLAFISFGLGDFDASHALYRESITLFEALGDQYGLALALSGWAWVGAVSGCVPPAEARAAGERSVAIARELGNRANLAMRLGMFGEVVKGFGELEHAQTIYTESLALARALDAPLQLIRSLIGLGDLSIRAGDLRTGNAYLQEALLTSMIAHVLPRALEAVVYWAALRLEESTLLGRTDLARKDKQVQALELVSLAQAHPACWRIWRDHASALRRRLEAALPPSTVAAATQRAGQKTLEEVVGELLSAELHLGDDQSADALACAAAPPAPAALIEPLTARELEVLRLVADGCSNQEIADTLILSIGTIKWYTRQVYSKLGVQTRTQALARAREFKLLT